MVHLCWDVSEIEEAANYCPEIQKPQKYFFQLIYACKELLCDPIIAEYL